MNTLLTSEERPMRVGLVGCVKFKQQYPAPAGELYISSLFHKASAYCAATYDRWAILSAEYGLVWPQTMLTPYDLTLNTMPVAERKAWALRVLEQLRAWETQSGVQPVYYFHAGQRYREHLLPALGGR